MKRVGDEDPAEVMRGAAQRALSMPRAAPPLILRFSEPKRRWNSAGDGGSHVRSSES
jgi:hypothetical protein